MDDYSGSAEYSGTLSGWGPVPEWNSGEPAPARPTYRRNAQVFDVGALPGETLSAAVLENRQQRRALMSVVLRYERLAAISAATFDSIRLFLDALPRSAPLPKVAPDGEGGLLLAWTLGDGHRTLVTVDDGSLHAVTKAGTAESEYFNNIVFEGDIPGDLLQSIQA